MEIDYKNLFLLVQKMAQDILFTLTHEKMKIYPHGKSYGLSQNWQLFQIWKILKKKRILLLKRVLFYQYKVVRVYIYS